MQPENATLKTLAQENAKKKQAKMQAKMQKQCSFWKFVFVKHAHFKNLHFFRIFVCTFFAFCLHFFCILPRFFAIFEKFEALAKPLPKNAKKNEQMQFAFLSHFFFLHFFVFCIIFAFFCILPRFFAIFEKFEVQTKPPPKNAKKKNEKHAICNFLHFCSHFF